METGEKQRVVWNCEGAEGWDGAGKTGLRDMLIGP